MASNYTEDYGLCQWEATDQVLREEFNQDHVKIDETLKAMADKDLALESAMTTVAAAAGNCQMELITYTGTGTYGTGKGTKITFSHIPDIYFIVGDLALITGLGGNKTPHRIKPMTKVLSMTQMSHGMMPSYLWSTAWTPGIR